MSNLIEFSGNKDFLKWLESKGYTNYPTYPPVYPQTVRKLFCKRIQGASPCYCNDDKVQYALYYSVTKMSDKLFDSVEVDLTAESGQEIWYQLQAYSMDTNDFMEKYEVIEKSLRAAWEAIASNSIVSPKPLAVACEHSWYGSFDTNTWVCEKCGVKSE